MKPLDERLAEYIAEHPGVTIEMAQELLWLAAAGKDEQEEA
jgi:hypothetical protein